LRPQQGLAEEAVDGVVDELLSREVSRHDDLQIVVKAQAAAVEYLVVERTESEAVGNLVRAAVLLPEHMGRFQADELIAKTPVKAANSATLLVGHQDLAPERWVPPVGLCRSKAEPQCGRDVVEVGWRPKLLENLSGKRWNVLSLEFLPPHEGNTAHNVVVNESPVGGLFLAGAAGEPAPVGNLPEAIVLEIPKGKLRMVNPPWRSKLSQGRLQVIGNVCVPNFVGFAALGPGQEHQGQERLVDRTLRATFPGPEVRDQVLPRGQGEFLLRLRRAAAPGQGRKVLDRTELTKFLR